jgi:hypothetical protein
MSEKEKYIKELTTSFLADDYWDSLKPLLKGKPKPSNDTIEQVVKYVVTKYKVTPKNLMKNSERILAILLDAKLAEPPISVDNKIDQNKYINNISSFVSDILKRKPKYTEFPSMPLINKEVENAIKRNNNIITSENRKAILNEILSTLGISSDETIPVEGMSSDDVITPGTVEMGSDDMNLMRFLAQTTPEKPRKMSSDDMITPGTVEMGSDDMNLMQLLAQLTPENKITGKKRKRSTITTEEDR